MAEERKYGGYPVEQVDEIIERLLKGGELGLCLSDKLVQVVHDRFNELRSKPYVVIDEEDRMISKNKLIFKYTLPDDPDLMKRIELAIHAALSHEKIDDVDEPFDYSDEHCIFKVSHDFTKSKDVKRDINDHISAFNAAMKVIYDGCDNDIVKLADIFLDTNTMAATSEHACKGIAHDLINVNALKLDGSAPGINDRQCYVIDNVRKFVFDYYDKIPNVRAEIIYLVNKIQKGLDENE